MNEKFDVTGMTCSACSSRVEKCVSKLEGVEEVSVNLLTNSMQVKYKEGEIDENAIISAVEKAGYGANLHQGAQPKKASVKVDAVEDAMHSMRYRLIVSIILYIYGTYDGIADSIILERYGECDCLCFYAISALSAHSICES